MEWTANMIPIGSDRFRSKAAASAEFGAGSGGDVDDTSRRLSAVEAAIESLREGLAELRGEIKQFATKAELNALETRLIYWIVGTALTLGIAQYLPRLFGP